MPIRKATPVKWSPKGCSDSVDGTTGFPGAMSMLQNLVPDPSTDNVFVPRPASVELTDFSDFDTPGFVSCAVTVGDLVYGMVASAENPGYDEPFVYDLDAGAFIAVSGVTSGNVPHNAPSSGGWQPPTVAIVGVYAIFTHTGFEGTPNDFGWLDITNPAAPMWDAGTTATHALSAVPKWVMRFSDRAYFAVNNTLEFTDILDPLTRTDADMVVTLGDSLNVICMGPLPLLTQLGGITQSMIAFKDGKTMFQITGDVALDTLKVDAVASGVGTQSPLSMCPTPKGLAYISDHGLRIVDQTGVVSPVIGADGKGISIPFINADIPSRISAAFNIDTIRISVTDSNNPVQPDQEWWYNIDIDGWTGPHTFPASLIQPWRGSFVMTPIDIEASLWQSDYLPTDTSSYTENGDTLLFDYSTVPLPLNQQMEMNAVVETSIGMAFQQTDGRVNFYAYDENGGLLDTCALDVTVAASFWGVMVWGVSLWGGTVKAFQQFRIPWTKPLSFGQMIISARGEAIPGFRIGNGFFRYQVLGFMLPYS